MRRTRIQDFRKVEEAKDLDSVVNDKRVGKRANKQKAKQRNRRYQNKLLKYLADSFNNKSED